jgi:hypothetical protein
MTAISDLATVFDPVSHRFAACWNDPCTSPPDFPLNSGFERISIGRTYPVLQGLNFGKAQE